MKSAWKSASEPSTECASGGVYTILIMDVNKECQVTEVRCEGTRNGLLGYGEGDGVVPGW